MTSHKEHPAVDTSVEKLEEIARSQITVRDIILSKRGHLIGKFEGLNAAIAMLDSNAAYLRSLAAHPAEPEGMELETTAEERAHRIKFPPSPDDELRLWQDKAARDIDRALRTVAERDAEIAIWRDCFAEITAKATPYGSSDDGGLERVSAYIIPPGPIHRAAGKTGFQFFGGEAAAAAWRARAALASSSPTKEKSDG